MENHLYEIRAVAEKTGLSTLLIRAWENRYSVVIPKRSDSKRRLYSDEDIIRLKLLKEATDKGFTIGRISNLSNEKLLELLQSTQKSFEVNQDKGEYFLNESLKAINDLSPKKLEKIFMKASIELSQPHFIDNLIVPLIYKIGEMWQSGDLRISHEHFSTSIIKNFLLNIIQSAHPQDNSPKIVVTTPSGQLHELGALIAACVASFEGWAVVYLGPNLPAEEIASSAIKINARVISLSIVYPLDDERLVEQLKRLKLLIPDDVRILIGGRGSTNYSKVIEEIKAEHIKDTSELREKLSHKRNI